MLTTKLMTIEEAEARRDTVWDYELVRGEFRPVMPSGGDHSAVGVRIAAILGGFILEQDLGEFYGADIGFILSRDPDTLLSPDFAFVRAEHVPEPDVHRGFLPVIPDLVVEVISPSTRRGELNEKIEIYLTTGVRMVWVADPDNRTITVHRPDHRPTKWTESDIADGGDVVSEFSTPVSRFFQRIRRSAPIGEA